MNEVNRLEALVALGVRVPVKLAGLRKLATMGSVGERILLKCIEVLEVTDKRRQYWPLLDLVMTERSIAEQCFPEAPSTTPEHMREAPDWLNEAETIQPNYIQPTKTRKL